MNSIRKKGFIFTLSFVMVACGGGSGSEATKPVPTNTPPVANAGADITIQEQENVYLEGTGSDSDGSISSYKWSQTSGTEVSLSAPTSPSTNFDAPNITEDEELVFKLVVTDNLGANATDSLSVFIKHVNDAPISVAGDSFESIQYDTIILDGSNSSDPDGDELTYSWGLVSAPINETAILNYQDTQSPTFTPNSYGEYTFELTVTDGELEDTSNIVVSVAKFIPSWMYEAEAKWMIPVQQLSTICDFSFITCSWDIDNLDIVNTQDTYNDGVISLIFHITEGRVDNKNISPSIIYHAEKWRDFDLEIARYNGLDMAGEFVWRECLNDDCTVNVNRRPDLTVTEVTDTGWKAEANSNVSDSMTMNGLYQTVLIIPSVRVNIDGSSAGSSFGEFKNREGFLDELYNTFKYVYGYADEDASAP
jgi:hypothetical protein